jgi:hypothetical protein
VSIQEKRDEALAWEHCGQGQGLVNADMDCSLPGTQHSLFRAVTASG